MSFTHAAFAFAGLVAAAGPVLIHLLNRRRYRTVAWGAMAFVQQAVQRSRRAVKLRDLLLLAVRTAVLICFGLALSRPVLSPGGAGIPTVIGFALGVVAVFGGVLGVIFTRRRSQRAGWGGLAAAGLMLALALALFKPEQWTSGETAAGSSRHPVHAIVVVDNSRSMAARTLEGTVLDQAKTRAADFIARLPAGSRTTILPLCGPERNFTFDPFGSPEDALAALERIDLTDRLGSAAAMFDLAAVAAERAPDLPGKRVLFLGDQQAAGWNGQEFAAMASALPGGVQVVSVEPAGTENIWIEDFQVQDGVAEAGGMSTFVVEIGCDGGGTVPSVAVTLSTDDQPLATRVIDLEPGRSRMLVMRAVLDAQAEAGESLFLPVTITLEPSDTSHDLLERDNSRTLSVPVVMSLPVVFVDQYGPAENLDTGRVGETRALRRLLSVPSRGSGEPALIEPRHLSIDELSESILRDARLVVVAGVERPTANAVELLREYVLQGGPLLITAGGDFDPAAWTAAAWDQGQGILPVPLADTPVGLRPSRITEQSEISPFFLDAGSLTDPLFGIADESPESLADLYRQPFFFQAVAAIVTPEVTDQASRAEESRLIAEQAAARWEESAGADRTESGNGNGNGNGSANGSPGLFNWLSWGEDVRRNDRAVPTLATLRNWSVPRVLGMFDRQSAEGRPLPFLVERQIGFGKVVLLTSGLSSDWDTLTQTTAVVLLDRLVRRLMTDTLPVRNFETGDEVTLDVERRANQVCTVELPDGTEQSLPIDSTPGGSVVRLTETALAGLYTVTSQPESAGAETVAVSDRDRRPIARLAVVGPEMESHLETLTAEALEKRFPESPLYWIGADEEIPLGGGSSQRDWMWKWFAVAVLVGLLLEMLIASRKRTSVPAVAFEFPRSPFADSPLGTVTPSVPPGSFDERNPGTGRNPVSERNTAAGNPRERASS